MGVTATKISLSFLYARKWTQASFSENKVELSNLEEDICISISVVWLDNITRVESESDDILPARSQLVVVKPIEIKTKLLTHQYE